MINWLRRKKAESAGRRYDRWVQRWRAESGYALSVGDDPTGIREAREQMSTIEGRREQAGYDRKR